MSMIEQLIQMKKAKKNNDIVNMLNEFTLYDKLSDIKALGDLETSTALQKRLPHLAKLVEGDFYNLSLATVARDVLTHLNYEIPSDIYSHMAEIPERTKKRMVLVGDTTVNAEYRELESFHSETNKENVIGVYTNNIEDSDMVRIIIIVDHSDERYTIYQGSYEEVEGQVLEAESKTSHHIEGYSEKTNRGTIRIGNYSIQGNNAYPFAEYVTHEGAHYISIPDSRHISITKTIPYWDFERDEVVGSEEMISLTTKEINELSMSRQEIEKFAKSIANIINRWEDQ